jgi:hypothetical protein
MAHFFIVGGAEDETVAQGGLTEIEDQPSTSEAESMLVVIFLHIT